MYAAGSGLVAGSPNECVQWYTEAVAVQHTVGKAPVTSL